MRCRASCTTVSSARPCSAAMRVSLACWSEVNCTSMSTFYRVGIAHVKREAFARVLSRNLLDNLRRLGERQKVGGQAALRCGSCVCGCDLNFGYQRRNRSPSSSLRTLVLVCSKRWAPRSVHCICCFLTNRLLTTWLIVDSTNAVLIVSPC